MVRLYQRLMHKAIKDNILFLLCLEQGKVCLEQGKVCLEQGKEYKEV